MRFRALIAAGAAACLLAGCGATGTTGPGDNSAGSELFTQKCGSCHTLADAGTRGAVGPDLDAAFKRSREDGIGESTLRDIVRGQMEYPVPPMPTRQELDLSDEDADNIASYVSSVASLPVAPKPAAPAGGDGAGKQDGKSIFAAAGCGSCHVLADAGTTGEIGPNLDDAKPSLELALDRVTNGSGVMPPFKGQLTDAEIQAVAEYVFSVAGK